VVSKKEFKTWADLNKPEVKIAVDIGSSHDQMISRVCPNATIVRLEKADDATLALQTGRVDAQVLVWLLALNVLKKNPSLGKMYVPQPLEATSTNIGVPKEEDKAWVETINKWIVAERAAGKIKPTVLGNLQKLSGVKPEDAADSAVSTGRRPARQHSRTAPAMVRFFSAGLNGERCLLRWTGCNCRAMAGGLSSIETFEFAGADHHFQQGLEPDHALGKVLYLGLLPADRFALSRDLVFQFDDGCQSRPQPSGETEHQDLPR
jgi:hypothetical protein